MAQAAAKHDWQPEDFTTTRVSLARICIMAQIVGYVRGLVRSGALSNGHTQCLSDLLAEYEAAQ